MEKIKLYNGHVFEIIPMGIETNKFEKTRKFSFVSVLSYEDIESEFSDEENISRIEYYSAAGDLLKTYSDCVSLKMLAKEFNREYEDGKFADVYTVLLNLT